MAKEFSEELERYEFSIDRWEHSYSYIADPLSLTEVDEFIHLETLDLFGKMTLPLIYAGSAICLMIASERPGPGDQPVSFRPVIGNVTIRGRVFDAYVQLPASHTARLTTVACTGRLKAAGFSAESFIRKRAVIRSMRVSTKAEE